MFNVHFGATKSFDDLGLIYNTKTIGEPTPQIRLVNIPGRNGALDLTEVLTNDVRYEMRTISMQFTVNKLFPRWEEVRSAVANVLHGNRFKIVFDDDPGYYWFGRVLVGDLVPDGTIATLTISAEVNPYKTDITSSAEPWLWDPFSFETGIINELYDIVVSGSKTVNIIVSGASVNPVITSDAAMTVTFDGNTYNIAAGTQTVYDILITEGENELTFTGNGTITIDYANSRL